MRWGGDAFALQPKPLGATRGSTEASILRRQVEDALRLEMALEPGPASSPDVARGWR